jgi:hypothetical protein
MNYLTYKKQIMSLTSKKIKETNTFKEIKKSENQYEYYLRNNASPEILKLVKMSNRKFGCFMEKLCIEVLGLNEGIDSTHDAIFQDLLCEIKASRFWVSTETFKWQHVMIKHECDFLLLCEVNFDHVNIYAITKEKVLDLHKEGKIKEQGKKNSHQGLWFTYEQIKNYLTKISSQKDLINFIEELELIYS